MRASRILATLLILGWATVPTDAGIETDVDSTVDFSRFQRFRVEAGTPAASERAEQIIQSTVAASLTARGLRADPDEPQIVFRTYALPDAHSIEELSDASKWEFWTGVRSITAYDLHEGTLVIDCIDPTTGRVIWRGLSTERLDDSAEATYSRIPKLVERLMRKFPKG